MDRCHLSHQGPAENKKAEEGGIHPFFSASLLELEHLILSSPALKLCLKPFVPLVLISSDLDGIIPLAFLGFQVANGRS